MGYTTEFSGSFTVTPPLSADLVSRLDEFNNERHDEQADSEGRPYPGIWCQWVATKDGTRIEWDGVEKFYEYTDWLKYIIEVFLEPNGHKLNGEVLWSGEDPSDVGILSANDNKVFEQVGRRAYGPKRRV